MREVSDTVGGLRQTERCQRVKVQEHLVWTPVGWIETSEAMVVHPYRASDLGPKRQVREASVARPCAGAEGRGAGADGRGISA